MRKYVYALLVMTIISCARDVSNVKSESVEFEDEELELLNEIEEKENHDIDKVDNVNSFMDGFTFAVPESPLMKITEQKTREYFDLIQLKKKHPKFQDDIILQLLKFSNDSTIGSNYTDDFRLDNIQIIEYLETNSTSIKKVKLYFDVIEGQSKFRDSIYALIDQKPITIDNEEINSYKVMFKKID
ncbi:MAG: hypothetical protein ACWA5P_03140 [bacterium]